MEVFGLFRLLKTLNDITQENRGAPRADAPPDAAPPSPASPSPQSPHTAQTPTPAEWETNSFLLLMERHSALSRKIDENKS